MSELNATEEIMQSPPSRLVARSMAAACQHLIDRMFAMGFGDEAAPLIKHIHRKAREQE